MDDLREAINLLRVELALIAEGQQRIFRLLALVVRDQDRILQIYDRAPILRGVAPGREAVN